jgi:hypothetical protein
MHRQGKSEAPAGASGSSRVRAWRLGAIIVALVLAVAAVIAVPLSQRGPSHPLAPVAAAQPAAPARAVPGSDPAIQHWLLKRDKLRVELNNLLLPFAQNQVTSAATAKSQCARLQVVAKLLNADHGPQAKVDTLGRTGLTQFEQGAAACLAGDVAGAKKSILDGLSARATAQAQLDNTLDGD